jgi:hypothetical protein
MSQHDFNIANQGFPATRADLNNALQALASNSSGDAEPSTTFANQWWYETDTNTLKLRNEANNAWLSFATVDQSTAAWTLAHDVTVSGAFTSLGIDDNATSTAITIDSSENVGIGTISPATLLNISSNSSVAPVVFTITDTDNAVPSGQVLGGINFETSDTTNAGVSAQIEAVYENASGATAIDFRTGYAGALVDTMHLDFVGRVGIGTSSPSALVHIKQSDGTPSTGLKVVRYNNDNQYLSLWANGGARYFDAVGDSSLSSVNIFRSSIDSGSTFTETMRIDSSGNLLVGTTSTTPAVSNDSDGIALQANGTVQFSANNTTTAIINRKATDGGILQFRKDGTTVGSISSRSSEAISIHTGTVGIEFNPSNQVNPSSGTAALDNVLDLGASGARWDDIYATNGTIQTSDRNEKQDIDVMSEAETRVAAACKGLIRKFRWIDAVAEKGDDARIHFGIIAQDLQDAFAAEGLDAGRYAMFISSTWWEADRVVPAVEAVEGAEATYDDEGNQLTEAVEAVVAVAEHTVTDHYETLEEAPEGATERTRLGVRYPELLAFIIAAL